MKWNLIIEVFLKDFSWGYWSCVDDFKPTWTSFPRINLQVYVKPKIYKTLAKYMKHSYHIPTISLKPRIQEKIKFKSKYWMK